MRKSSFHKNPIAEKLMNPVLLQWVVCVLVVLVSFMLQMTPKALEIAGAKPWVLFSSTICIALFMGPVGGGIMGAIAGLLWDVFADCWLGHHAILLMLFGTVCGILIWLVFRNNIYTALLMLACSILLFILIDWGLSYVLFEKSEPLVALWSVFLPNGLYTFLISPIVYGILYVIIQRLRKDN